MPSSYTPRLRLELQATGENRSTWGIKANNDFTLIEVAIAGYTSIPMADANITLTAANAATDQSRNMMLSFTGANTAVRTATVPSVSKLYMLQNATTGGFDVSIKTSAGAAISLHTGSSRMVWCDGTDMHFAEVNPEGVVSVRDYSGTNTVGGTAAAITITTTTKFTALANTVAFAFKAASTSVAGGTTVALDGLAAKKIRKIVSAGDVDINAGDFLVGGIYTLRYDTSVDSGNGGFIVMSPLSGEALLVGDFKDTVRTLNSSFLRRNGGIYNISSYPELAALLPPLPDGVTWSNVTVPPTSGDVRTIISTPSGFMFLQDDGTNSTVYTSANGTTWSSVATINAFRVYCVIYANSIYVATDGNGYVSRSSDGISWSAPVLLSGSASDFFISVAYGAGLFVAVGGNASVTSKIYTSPDGVTWTSRTPNVATPLNGVKFVNSTFVAVGNNGVITTSTNGTTWTARTSGISVALRDVTYGNSLYVVVGDTGTIITSSALTSWTTQTSSTTTGLNSIVYSTAGFSIIGSNGVSRISTNGTTWTATATGVSNTMYCIIVDPNNVAKYYATGTNSKVITGLRTLPSQFQVPNDNPTYGWIKATS